MDISIIEKYLDEFLTGTEAEFTYPLPLTKKERIIVHEICEKKGLFSESVGEGSSKKMIIKREKGLIVTREISDEERKLFIKDYNLPIPVYREPYFSYFIELFDEMYDTKRKLKILTDAVVELKTQGKKLKATSYEIMELIVSKIKSLPAYTKFTTTSGEYPNVVLPKNTNIWNVHQKEFPAYYISCDIKKANFNAMKFYDPELVLGSATWEELISKYTSIPYFIESKHFRQIVFGNLKGKRISAIERHLQSYLYNLVKDVVNVSGKMSDDEFIIRTTKDSIAEDVRIINSILATLPENMQGIW